jgi:hypothetical protein
MLGTPLPVWMRLVLGAVAALLLIPACGLFGLGDPSTRALETGVTDSLSSPSFEMAGSYTSAGASWTVDFQFGGPGTEHAVITQGSVKVEAIVVGGQAYYRGQEFLTQHLGSASAARTLVQAAGNAWWKGPATNVPSLPEFTDAARFRATFLGPAVSTRTDHEDAGGIDSAELSGLRGNVFIAEDPPHRLVRVELSRQATIDGIGEADFEYSNFGADFKITKPTDVIDFSNLSTLPPLYTVMSVDTSKCVSPCVVSAVVKNLGGKTGAKAPSSVIFTMTDLTTNNVIGTCTAQITPDIGFNATTRVSCTITVPSGQKLDAVLITASPDNPGHA